MIAAWPCSVLCIKVSLFTFILCSNVGQFRWLNTWVTHHFCLEYVVVAKRAAHRCTCSSQCFSGTSCKGPMQSLSLLGFSKLPSLFAKTCFLFFRKKLKNTRLQTQVIACSIYPNSSSPLPKNVSISFVLEEVSRQVGYSVLLLFLH